eukprot:1901521-Ditylum_brightwellii.AAC.1
MERNKALLNPDQQCWLQDVVHQQGVNNEGMTRRKCVTVISEVGQTSCTQKAEDHLNYLIRKKRLLDLKWQGR